MERRALLRRAVAVGVATLAGCGSTPANPANGDDPTRSPRGDGSPTPTPAPPRAVTDATVETVETDCHSGEEPGATVTFPGGESVAFAGRLTASNPCQEITIESTNYDANEDRVVVTLGTTNRDQGCVMCTGVVVFEGNVAFEGGLPAAVRITHEGTVLADVDRHGGDAIAESGFSVVDQGGGANAPRADVTFQDGTDRVVVDGTIRGADGCRTAELARVDYDDGADTATIVVGTTQGPDAGADCPDETVGVVYEATATFGDGLPERVTVVHGETVVVTAGR